MVPQMQALENLTYNTPIAVRFQIGKDRCYRWYIGKIKELTTLRPGMIDDGYYREVTVDFNDGESMYLVLFTTNFRVKERGSWSILTNQNIDPNSKVPFFDSQILKS